MNPGTEFLKRFFTFKAFSPDIKNPTLPLYERVGNNRVALLSIGPNGIKTASARISKNKVDITDLELFPIRIPDTNLTHPALSSLIKKTDINAVAVCAGFKCMLRAEIVGMQRDEPDLNETPTTGLPPSDNQSPRRVMAYNSEVKGQIYWGDMEEDLLNNIEETLTNNGLTTVRMQIGSMSILNVMASDPKFTGAEANTIGMILDHGNLSLVIRNGQGDKDIVRTSNGVLEAKTDVAPEKAIKLQERIKEFLKGLKYKPHILLADTDMPNSTKLFDHIANTEKTFTWARYCPEGLSDPCLVDFVGLTQK